MQFTYRIVSDTTMYVNLWCTVELDLSIIGGSVPSMKPFVRRHFPRLLGLKSKKQSSSSEPACYCSRKKANKLESLGLSQQLEDVPSDESFTRLVESRNVDQHHVSDV